MTINGVTATYDALGRMVEFNRSGTNYEIVYDPTGSKLALMNGQSLQKGFVSLPGNAMAVYNSSGLDHYRHSDWLGSARLFTSATQSQTPLGEVAYSPYGETYAQTGLADFSFTGMNDDADPTNPALIYDFPAREYGIQGRWPSPDPAGLLAVDPSNPQSWNRYAYALNNPLTLADPSGETVEATIAACSNPILAPVCIIAVVTSIIEFFKTLFDFFGFFSPPPPQAAPPPPGGYGAGIDPYGTWNEKLPAGVQALPSVFPGLNSPAGSGCDLGVCDDFRNGGIPPRPQLFPGLDFAGYVIRIFVTERLETVSNEHAETIIKKNFPTAQFSLVPIQRPRFSQHDRCLAKKLFPAQAVAQGTEFGITKLLDLVVPGSGGGMEAAGPFGLMGTAAGSVIGCEKELGIGNF